MEIRLRENVMKANDQIAAEIRELLKEKNIFTINFISSPGSGKTSLLERTIPRLQEYPCGVIEGDVATDRDAARVGVLGVPVVQIETKGGCHLDANMVKKALTGLQLPEGGFLFIENVGNLVCPSGYDLGEDLKVVVLSVVEGDDKPGKYPGIFHNAQVAVLNKIDLLPYTNFQKENFYRDARSVNSRIEIFEVSCRTEEGIDQWIEWLKEKKQNK